MAARSPNIKLRKALNRESSSIKCPLSAPAKPSKPRIPRFAMVSSLTQKKVDPQTKNQPSSKLGSTPVAKSRQVASKYMTTPRNKICHPNENSFRSVQNPKTTIVDAVKNRPIAKALVFHSPKKAIVLKKSFELHTPVTKICEGMKRLKIASQKKTVNGNISKPKTPETEGSSRRQLKTGSKKESKDLTPNKKTATYKCQSLHGQGVDLKEDLHHHEISETSNSNVLKDEMNDIEDKENMVSEQMDIGKENVANPQDNNRSNNQPSIDKILNKETHKKNKAVQTAGPGVMKCKKPKPTSVKPFRLRTDERGILREAILEKKLHVLAPTKEVDKDITVVKRTYPVPKKEKLSVSDNGGKESGPDTARRHMSSLKTRSQRMPGQQLSVIKEKSSKLPSAEVAVNKKDTTVSAAGSTSRGKQHVTVAKEPKFHTSHLPRTCSKKIA